MQLLWIGMGGFVGATGRFLVASLVQRWSGGSLYPYGTLAVNVVGCLIIGLLGGLDQSRQLFGPAARSFIFIGVLGGFTTFSSFGYETLNLAQSGQSQAALLNVALQLGLGLGAAWLGLMVARFL